MIKNTLLLSTIIFLLLFSFSCAQPGYEDDFNSQVELTEEKNLPIVPPATSPEAVLGISRSSSVENFVDGTVKGFAEYSTGKFPVPYNIVGAAAISAFWPGEDSTGSALSEINGKLDKIYNDLQSLKNLRAEVRADFRNEFGHQAQKEIKLKVDYVARGMRTTYLNDKTQTNLSSKTLADTLLAYHTMLDQALFWFMNDNDLGVHKKISSLGDFSLMASIHIAVLQELIEIYKNENYKDGGSHESREDLLIRYVGWLEDNTNEYKNYLNVLAPEIRNYRLSLISSPKYEYKDLYVKRVYTYYIYIGGRPIPRQGVEYGETGFVWYSVNDLSKATPYTKYKTLPGITDLYKREVGQTVNSFLSSELNSIVSSFNTIIANGKKALDEDKRGWGEPGLTGRYYDYNWNFKFYRVEPKVDFNWGTTPLGNGIGSDYYIATWKGYIKPPCSGDYTFYTYTDDGVRLELNHDNVQDVILNDWSIHPPKENTSKTVYLEGGRYYPIQMYYYECTGGAVARLSWKCVAKEVQHNSFDKEVIPTRYLFSGRVGE